MGSVADLKDAVKDALQSKGLLPQLQANIRSQIFNLLLASEDAPRPEPCDETLIINELIREYLVWHNLRDTLSVFIPESGQPATRPFDRSFLAHKLRIADTPQAQQVPLLYHMVAQQQQGPQSSRKAGASSSSCHQHGPLQHQHQAQDASAAGRLQPPAMQQEQQPLALKAAESDLSDMQSPSSMSHITRLVTALDLSCSVVSDA